MKHILITGSTGLLGSTLVQVLGEKGHTVYEMNADIRDEDAIRDYKAPNANIDWVIHTAAMTDVSACEQERSQCYEVNTIGTRRMREVAKAFDAQFLYISTVQKELLCQNRKFQGYFPYQA